MPRLLHLDFSARRSSFSRELSARYAAGWTGTRTSPRAPFAHHERYLRDFNVRFVHAELTNALVDPHLAARDGERKASREAALEAIRWAG